MEYKDLVVADVPSTVLFGKHGLKYCQRGPTELRYTLYFDHTWVERCPKCGRTSKRG